MTAETPARGAAGAEAPVVRAVGVGKVYGRGLFGHGTFGHSTFGRGRGRVAALADVDLAVAAGTTTAVVGASGGGKSTLARCLALLERPSAGEVEVDGRPTRGLSGRELAALRPRLQLIFQQPSGALNPRFTALDCVAEPLRVAGRLRRAEQRTRALALMAEVGLEPELAGRRPLALSGGQRQRLVIARALAAEPRLLILDEALTGLDLPLQARLVELLRRLQRERGLAYLLISHDLRLVAHLADHLAVTLAVIAGGRLVETGPAGEVLAAPRHDATRELVAALPRRRLGGGAG